MESKRLEHCLNGCCWFVDGTPVTEREYAAALRDHPGSYPAVQPFGRNAVSEAIVACRKDESGSKH